MTSGNINRSLGLSALTIMSIAGLVLSGSGAARANIDPTIGGAPTTVAENNSNQDWDYTYDIVVTDDQTVVTGSTFTFSDFYGFVAPASMTITTATGTWTESVAFNTPPGYEITGEGFTYDPTVASVTFTYDGSNIVGSGTAGTSIGAFTLESIYGYNGTTPSEQEFVGDADKTGPPLQGNANFTTYYGPTDGYTPTNPQGNPVTPTPEPGIFVTAGSMLGMTGLGLVRGRRRAKGTKVAA